ncbi:MAG: Uncharacterised protein [Synechococcus sp. CC9902]|nr:MAG: Uncharacterised protein [Synechococcus sp. CC9902]
MTEGIQGRLEPSGAGLNGHLGGQGRHRKTLLRDRDQLALIQDRSLEMNHRRSLSLRLQSRTTLSQMHLEAHDELFAQWINRRVGDLGEALLEVVVKKMWLVGENRQRNVVSHAVGRLFAESRHVLDDHVEVLCGEAHRGLQTQQIQLTHLTVLGPGLWINIAAMLLKPLAVREAGGSVFLHGPVVEQLARFQINGEHLPRAEPPLLHHGFVAEIHHAGLRSHDHKAVLGGAPARRTQTVAVEGGAHTPAIGKHQKGRAIPWLLDPGIEFVHGRHLRTAVEIGLVAKRFRNQSDQAVGDGAAAPDHQFKRGIEVGRIAERGIDDGDEVISGITPDIVEGGLRCLRPVEIAQQRVDLTVVTQQAHRLGQGPTRQRVGAETAVVNRKTHSKAWIAKVGVVLRQHLGAHHALVNNGAAAQGSDVEVVLTIGLKGSANSCPDPATQAHQQSFKVAVFGMAIKHPLLDHRGCLPGHGAKHPRIHRHGSPPKGTQPECRGFLVTKEADILPTASISRHEHHAEPLG